MKLTPGFAAALVETGKLDGTFWIIRPENSVINIQDY
jgi:hypothetical protein